MSEKVRFAPSPTGYIHIGNARTALLNWLYAKKHDGAFLLRLDDTDTGRSKQEFADAIAADLAWLGIHSEETARQSDRFERYDAVAEDLKTSGKLYACYETPEELERKRRLQLNRGKPPVYDRAGLQLTDDEKKAFEDEGRKPHWRFLLEEKTVGWSDLVRGDQTIEAGSLSDPVLIRADGTYLYTLPSVVDDIDFRISLVVRGEDHVANTGVQIQMFEALGAKPPKFAHHNLLTDASGEGLSKRMESLSIRALRDAGYEPMAVASLATTIGTSDPVAAHASIDDLVDLFDFAKLSRAPARFDPKELDGLNAKLLHQMSYDDVAERLDDAGVEGGEAFWKAIRGNVEKLSDAAEWWKIVSEDLVFPCGAEQFLLGAASVLPEEPWDDETWSAWTKAVKEKTGAKGRELFMPLRNALTGKDHGPEMSGLLPLIGRDQVMCRLMGDVSS